VKCGEVLKSGGCKSGQTGVRLSYPAPWHAFSRSDFETYALRTLLHGPYPSAVERTRSIPCGLLRSAAVLPYDLKLYGDRNSPPEHGLHGFWHQPTRMSSSCAVGSQQTCNKRPRFRFDRGRRRVGQTRNAILQRWPQSGRPNPPDQQIPSSMPSCGGFQPGCPS
jgi:hypothetical protein